MSDGFRPAWWLRNPHAQTIWGKFLRHEPPVATRRERWELDDGDFLDLHRLDAPVGRPRLIMLHGLEGSRRSHYANGFFAEASRLGWAADLLVFRSCGDEPNRLLRSYHSGETGDIGYVISRTVASDPDRPLVLAGVSLGGNVMLKWLGEQGDRAKRIVVAAAAISTPYDLALGCRYMERGFSKVYQAHFLRTLRGKAREKSARFPGQVRMAEIDAARTLWDFDDVMTAPTHGFRDAADYYARSSSLGYIAAIRVPTLLLSAVDDPFLPPSVLDDVSERAAGNPSLSLEFPPHGGHVGFVSGSAPWSAGYYAERHAISFLAARLAARVDAARAAR
jgi:predicted alpha/beta-fold hydrolase